MNLGTVNGYMPQTASFNGKRFVYNGTTRGLEKAAIEAGAGVGDTVTTHVLDDRDYVLEFNPHITHNSLQVQASRVFA